MTRKLLQQKWVLLVLTSCWTGQPLCAQSPDVQDRLSVARVRAPLGSSEITVAVTGGASARVVGYQFAVGHDANAAMLVDVQVSSAVADHGADLVLTSIDNHADAPFGAILVALDGTAPFGDVLPLDISRETELARFVYELEPGVALGQSTVLELRHRTFGTPPVAAIFVGEDLKSIHPEVADGEIRVAPAFLRGDCNHDGLFDVADPVSLLLYLFEGTVTPPCRDGCDANDDGELNLTDALAALEFLFSEGAAPSSPFPQVGVDASPDLLTCLEIADSDDPVSAEKN